MLSPKHQRYAERIREMIEEGKAVAKLERPAGYTAGTSFIQDQDKIPLQAWLVKVSNILETVFGPESPQIRHLKEVTPFSNDEVRFPCCNSA